MITPEIAAFVVREYLLPMFEGKNSNRNNTSSKSVGKNNDISNGLFSNNKTVFSECKLSDLLLS